MEIVRLSQIRQFQYDCFFFDFPIDKNPENVIGVTTEEAMHGKGLVWFAASILHAILFNMTATLRVTDRKHFTVPAMIDQLEAIKADKNIATGKRERRYKLTSRQQKIFHFWEIDEKKVDERIAII